MSAVAEHARIWQQQMKMVCCLHVSLGKAVLSVECTWVLGFSGDRQTELLLQEKDSQKKENDKLMESPLHEKDPCNQDKCIGR